MNLKISDSSQFSTNHTKLSNNPEKILVTLSSVKASSQEEAEALLKAIGFTQSDIEAFKNKYGVDLKTRFADEFSGKPSRITKDTSSKPGFQAYIGISSRNYKLLTGFLAERRGTTKNKLPVETAEGKKIYDNTALQALKLKKLADKAHIETTSVGTPRRLDELRHFSVLIAPGTKAAETDKVLSALIDKTFGDRIEFAQNRETIRQIAKMSGVELKNVKINGNRAEFDLTLGDTLKLRVAYNKVQDDLNRAEAIYRDTVDNNTFSQFAAGVFEGASDSIAGTANILIDPVGTAQALWQVIGNPSETFNALYKELEDTSEKFKAADHVERSRMIGKLLGSVITGILIGKGAGELGALLKGTKTGAALMEKAEKLKVLTTAKIGEAFSDEAAQLAKQKFANRLKELNLSPNSITNIAADPELWTRASQIAGNTVSKGYTKFADFSVQVKKALGNIGESAMEKLYRESLVSLDLNKGRQILSSGGRVIDEAIVKEAKEKAVQFVQENKVKELKEYLNEIGNKYGTQFQNELKKTVQTSVDNIYEGRRTPEIYDMLGGHTIYDLFDGKIDTKHVGKTVEQLRERLAKESKLDFASSFKNLETANNAQMKFIKQYEKEIAEWLTTNKGNFTKTLETGQDLGNVVGRGKFGVKTGTKVEVTLARDNTEQGWHIVTSYPKY